MTSLLGGSREEFSFNNATGLFPAVLLPKKSETRSSSPDLSVHRIGTGKLHWAVSSSANPITSLRAKVPTKHIEARRICSWACPIRVPHCLPLPAPVYLRCPAFPGSEIPHFYLQAHPAPWCTDYTDSFVKHLSTTMRKRWWLLVIVNLAQHRISWEDPLNEMWISVYESVYVYICICSDHVQIRLACGLACEEILF